MRDLAAEILNTRVPSGAIAIWWLGQHSFVVKGGGKTISFDPYLTDYPGGMPRRFPPLIQPGDLKGIDLVLCSHEHVDHVDPWTLGPMARNNPGARFVAPECCVPLLLEKAGIDRERVTGTRAGNGPASNFAGAAFTVSGVPVTPVAAAHESLEWTEATGQRWQGYAVHLDGITLLHTGDTTAYHGIVETVKGIAPDVMLAPINGKDYFRNQVDIIGNMDVREAAELAVRAGVKLVIPTHYDLFAGNAEWPGRFVDYLYQWYPEQPCKIMARGERFFYVKAD